MSNDIAIDTRIIPTRQLLTNSEIERISNFPGESRVCVLQFDQIDRRIYLLYFIQLKCVKSVVFRVILYRTLGIRF